MATAHRARNRVSVRLAFRLPQARRVFLIVRGPAPACRTAGYIPVRGRKGVNSVYFAGRVHGRRLVPGVYLISISPSRSPVPGAPTEYVRVVSPRRSLPLPDSARKPSCSVTAASTPAPVAPFVPADPFPRAPVSRPTARLAGGTGATTSPNETEEDDGAAGLPDSGVLGATTEDGTGHAFAAIALLALVGALLLAMLALVTRFLRGSWNP